MEHYATTMYDFHVQWGILSMFALYFFWGSPVTEKKAGNKAGITPGNSHTSNQEQSVFLAKRKLIHHLDRMDQKHFALGC